MAYGHRRSSNGSADFRDGGRDPIPVVAAASEGRRNPLPPVVLVEKFGAVNIVMVVDLFRGKEVIVWSMGRWHARCKGMKSEIEDKKGSFRVKLYHNGGNEHPPTSLIFSQPNRKLPLPYIIPQATASNR